MTLVGDIVFAFALATGLAGVHLVADKVPFAYPLTRERWLSAGAGVSIAYVFIYLIPKLGHAHVQGTDALTLINLLVFCGLAGFFGLERIARETESHHLDRGRSWITDHPGFWVHIGVFAIYNAVIGYGLMSGSLIERQIPYAIAMGVHLFAIDEGLRNYQSVAYHGIGRWVLAGSILVGAVLAVAVTLGVSVEIWLLSLLAGGIIFNAIKEELPEDRKSSFWTFIAGAGLFVGVVTLLA